MDARVVGNHVHALIDLEVAPAEIAMLACMCLAETKKPQRILTAD